MRFQTTRSCDQGVLRLVIQTARLTLRLPEERDRSRFVELFSDESFMVFSAGVLAETAGHARFDVMLANAADVPFAKQPVIETATGNILGYSGVAWFDLDGARCLEFGYRLCTEARGKGYATEAGLALVALARSQWSGPIYAMVDPSNEPSMRVIDKLGFDFVDLRMVQGYLDNFYRIDCMPR